MCIICKNNGIIPAGTSKIDCSGCTSLTSLPTLPPSLIQLYCRYCISLTTLPTLPSSLTYLYCTGCTSQTSLPDLLGRPLFSQNHRIRNSAPLLCLGHPRSRHGLSVLTLVIALACTRCYSMQRRS